MVASCSIPILFEPIVIDGEQYVDGGVFMNLPARPIRESCDFLLGINLSPEVDNTPTKNMLRLSDRLIRVMMRANVTIDLEPVSYTHLVVVTSAPDMSYSSKASTRPRILR